MKSPAKAAIKARLRRGPAPLGTISTAWRAASRAGGGVLVFDQEPVRGLAARPVALHAHQHPASMQAFALKDEFHLALLQGLQRVSAIPSGPVAAVPHLHRAAAILALGDGPLEVAVTQRMVFHLHRQAFVSGIQRGAAGHRP